MASQPKREPRFTLSDVPTAMRREGWPMGARLMERWLSQAAYQMSDAVKRGVQPAPPRAIDTQSVTMDWAMRVSRFAQAHTTLLATWSVGERLPRSAGQVSEQLKRWITTPGVNAAKPFRFGDLTRGAPDIDQRCAINREVVTSPWYNAVDDFYAAFGNALVRLAVSGMVKPIPGGWRVSIDEVGTYLRDTYDFNGDQPLGSWGPSGLSRAAVFAPEIEVDPNRPTPALSQGQAFFKVGNDSFRRFRALTGRGGDFMIYSDVRRTKLGRPVVVMVRA